MFITIVVALVLLPFVFAAIAALFADKRSRRGRRRAGRQGTPDGTTYVSAGV